MKLGYLLTMRKGLPAFVYREIDGWEKLGHEVFVYPTRRGNGPYMPKSHWSVRYWGPLFLVFSFIYEFARSPILFGTLLFLAFRSNTLIDFLISLAFAQRIRSDQLDALLCFEGLHCLRIGYYCHRFTNVNISVIVHAEMLRLTSHRDFTRTALLSCNKIISPTQLNCKRIVDEFNLPPNKVALNHMSIDTDKFRPKGKFKILIIAFFAQRKGHETLLRAIKYLKRNDIVAWIVGGEVWGDKSDMFDVAGFIKDNDLYDNVVMFGRVTDEVVHVLLETCDAFCLPCKTPPSGVIEGLPVALMEAMSYEKPVISTRHSGIPELLPDILLDENDYIGIADAIIRLKDDPDLCHKMGSRNRSIIKQSFGLENIQRLAELITEK